jgi:hypothetical protein
LNALLGAFIALLAVTQPAHAATLDATPGNYRTLLTQLKPGDTLVLASGTYTQGLPLDGLTGTAALPIAIRGPADQSAVFPARSCCNTVQLSNTSYVQVSGLTLDGVGLDGPFGVDSNGACHHITLENLRIVNHGAQQQVVGISSKGPAWNWTIRRNTIIGAGTGIYLGNSDGTAPFVGGVIENNLIVDTLGYNMQIKHQLPRPTTIGMPTTVQRTIIRHNVFSKANNASTSDLARPNLLLGHLPLSGAGVDDRYEVYGNFFYENGTEALFQGEGNIALYDNVFFNSRGAAVNIQQHINRPRNVTVMHNTVVASGTGIRVSNPDPAFTQRIIANAVYAATPVAGPNQQDNVTGAYSAAATALNSPTPAIATLDLYPRTGQLVGSAVSLDPASGFTDGTLDFNGQPRTGVHRGAYEGDGANTGWKLALALKNLVRPNPPTGLRVE